MPSKINIANYFRRIQEYFRGLPLRGRIFALLGAALVMTLASWQIYSHMEERRLIKSPDEPAAVLLRDDAAKPKDPALFLQAQSRLQENLRMDGETRHVFLLELRLDEKACREYYGDQDGTAQCKNNWGLLAPGEKDWGVSPDLPGQWSFDGMPYKYSARFAFNPSDQSAWTRYSFKLPSRLGKNVHLAPGYEAFFTSSAFSLDIREWTFLADPQNPRNLMLSGKITAAYPLDRDSLKAALRLEPAPGIKLGEPELVFAQDNLSLAVNVKVLSLPEENAPVRLALNKGVRRAGRQERTDEVISKGANVPGKDVFVSLERLSNFIHTDDELNSRQMLALEFTRPVRVKEAQESTVVLMLPAYANKKDEQARRLSNWGSEENSHALREISRSADSMTKIELTPIDGQEEYSRTVSFTYSAPGGRWLIAHNRGGTASLTDYKLAAFARVMPIRSFEPEARIMQKGTILSLNGAKKLALISRSVDTVKVSAYRVRPEFINLLVSQTNKVITSPDFEYGNLQMEDISERLELSYKPQKNSGHEPDYHALDLTPLLSGGGKGIFRLELRGYDSRGAHITTDIRFMLLTDLAVNLKQGRRGEREVFVSSFSRGAPLDGAQVQVIGRNGLPVFSKNTGADGRVNIPPLEGLTRERKPIAVTVSLGRDLTFMALEDYTREVPLARYPETAGRQADSKGVSAFVFSERGMFKPGEELRFGVLLKSSTWDSAATKGLPVRVVLTNPRGTKVYDKQHRQDETGLIALAIPSQETDPTGLYNLGVYLNDRHLGYAQVQVEEFQPDNLKVNASFKDISPLLQQGWALPQNLSALVLVENLYGVPAADNRVEASVALAPARLAFSQYSDYRFFDPGTTEQSRHINLGSVNTNERGEAEFKLDLGGYAGGAYRLNLETQAFESGGGRGVSAAAQLLVSPFTSLVGWKSEIKGNFVAVNSEAMVSFIAIDNTLKRIQLDNLEVSVSEVEYVSSLVRDNSGRYRYDKVRRLKPVDSRKADLPEDGLFVPLPTETTGEFELALTDAEGRLRCRMNYVVAGGSARRFGLERDATLRAHLDKLEYKAGETMQVFVSAPYAGSGLITLESDQVISHKWFTASTSDSVQTLTVPEGFEGRGFVSVSLVRSLSSDAVYSPPYSHTVVPFLANIDKRDLKLSLGSQELIRPGETLRMSLKAERPGKAVVFAVNEGILQLTSYSTPSPLTYFLKQNPLNVRTMQNWDLLMPEFNMMHQSIFGGDLFERSAKEAPGLNPFRRKSEPSVVYWSGLVDVGPEARELTWDVPAYFNGSLRLMAVAAGASSVGEGATRTLVRGPLVITPDLPVAAAPGDEFEVTAAIANNLEGSGKALPVSVKVELKGGLEMIRQPAESLLVDEGRDGRAVFRLRATQALGEATAVITAQSSFQGQKVTVNRPVSLSVRPASPRMSSFKAGVIKERSQTVPVGRKLFAPYAQIEAGVSGLPLPLLDALAGFLTRYPHGCTEQILSSAFPYALLNKTPELMPVPKGMEAAALRALSEKAVNKGLIALQERQTVPGRFTLWPYGGGTYPFLTAYSLDFMLSAREAGYAVPEELFRSTQQETAALLQKTPTDLEGLRTVSYAAWVYTRSGKRFAGLPQLVRDLDTNIKDWRQTPSAALLAACFQMMQQSKEAGELIGGVKALYGQTALKHSWFYSRLWDNGLMLSALARHFPERLPDLEGQRALVQIVNDIAGNDYSTPSAAQAVRALADYAAANLGNKAEGLEISALDEKSAALTAQTTGDLVKRLSMGNEAAAFRFAGGQDLYWQISTDGFDLLPPKAQAKKLSLKTTYVPAGGKKLEDLTQGDEVYVLISAAAATPTDNVAITSMLPGGFEMVISKGGRIVGGGASAGRGPASVEDGESDEEDTEGYDGEEGYEEEDGEWELGSFKAEPNPAHLRDAQVMLAEAKISGAPMSLVHVERREDRVVAYAGLIGEERLFIYKIKAVNKGKFTLPSAYAEALYDPEARANTEAGTIEVK